MTGHAGPFHPGDHEHTPISTGDLSGVTEPLPENVQDAAIKELRGRLTSLQQRRAKLVRDLQALDERIAGYERNHPNL